MTSPTHHPFPCPHSLVIALSLLPNFLSAEEPSAVLPEHHFDFLDTYCLTCHDADTEKGDINLEYLPFDIATIPDAELWQKVLDSLNSGEMPPEDKKQPEGDAKADFLDSLANTLVTARSFLSDSGGEITMRRLNRREYENTIESLIGVRPDAGSLPADGGSGTFDTVGSSQFISSDQIEQYLKLGRTAVDEWFERRSALAQETKIFRVEPETTVNVRNLEFIEAQEERYERLVPWMAAVQEASKAPENEEVMAQLREEHPDIEESAYRLYRISNRLAGVPDPEEFGFRDAESAMNFYQLDYETSHESLKHYAALPHNDRGTYLRTNQKIVRLDIVPPAEDIPPGTYKLRVRAGVVEGSSPERHFIEVGHPQRRNQTPSGFANLPLSSHAVTGTIDSPEVIEITVELGVDTPKEFGIQERQAGGFKELRNIHYRHKRENGHGTPPAIWVDWIELEGPIKDAEGPPSNIIRVEPEETINPANEEEIAKIEEHYERFTRWQVGVDEAAATPENQAIIAEIRETDRLIDHPARFYSYADRFEGTPDPTDFGFTDSKKAAASNPEADRANLAYHKHYAALPHRDQGTYLKVAHGTGRVIVAPEDLSLGRYTLRVRVGAVEGSPASRHFIEVGHPQREIESRNWGLEGLPISSHQVTGTIEEPQTIEIPLEVGANTIPEFAVQERQPNNGSLKALWDAHNALKQENGYGHPPAIWIDWIELEGPHETSHSGSDTDDWWVTAAADPDESSRARTVLEQFAFNAFRGVGAEAEYIDRLSAIYESRRTAGEPFDEAIRLPMSIVLASPGFLYLNEPSDPSERVALTDRELAIRLAYFLWSAPPDQELLDLAEQNELGKPEVLRGQVDRLIADSRSDEFVSGFVHQWLDMERLDFFQFDTKLHREFDESTRSAARQEVYQSFAHLLRDQDGGRLGKLLKTDTVFVNALLANYYGIEGVTGDEFRRVALPADSPRGGLLGMAAIHAMGSDGIESSPVERGAWVLRHLLHDAPPPAPANVPQLSRLAEEPLTTREKLAAHQEEPQCASCHRNIDPIGFGLENFDAAGRWRTTEGTGRRAHDIDPSGAFHNGPAFADYFELRDLIAAQEDAFARGFTEHLIGYALGRPFGFTDGDLADQILASAREKDFSTGAFIHALIQSEPFHTK